MAVNLSLLDFAFIAISITMAIFPGILTARKETNKEFLIKEKFKEEPCQVGRVNSIKPVIVTEKGA